MWQTALLPGILIGLGLTFLIAQLLPTQPKLSAAIERLGSTQDDTLTGDPASQTLETRVGGWVRSALPDFRAFAIPTRDLSLIGWPVNTFLFRKARYAALLLVVPSLLGLELQYLGLLPFFIPAIAGPVLAVVGWFSVDIQVRREAAAAREEFSRAVAIYLELVAAERKRGASAGVALAESAEVGRSWVFVRIREELTRARYAGVQPWDALSRFSDEISVPELNDVANIMRQSGEQGSAVYETLRQRGKSLRVQLLNAEQTRANKTTQLLAVPMTGLAGVFVGIIMTALLLNLVNS